MVGTHITLFQNNSADLRHFHFFSVFFYYNRRRKTRMQLLWGMHPFIFFIPHQRSQSSPQQQIVKPQEGLIFVYLYALPHTVE